MPQKGDGERWKLEKYEVVLLEILTFDLFVTENMHLIRPSRTLGSCSLLGRNGASGLNVLGICYVKLYIFYQLTWKSWSYLLSKQLEAGG